MDRPTNSTTAVDVADSAKIGSRSPVAGSRVRHLTPISALHWPSAATAGLPNGIMSYMKSNAVYCCSTLFTPVAIYILN